MHETACQKSSEKKSAHKGRFALSIPYRDEGSEATG